jgi:enterochelin esterase-like enzyme
MFISRAASWRTLLFLAALVAAGLVAACGSQASASSGAAPTSAAAHRSGRPTPAVVQRALPDVRGRLLIVHFYSRALGKRADYLVYLPAEYTPSRRLPVFYMLHGMPGRPMAFTVNADAEVKLESLIGLGRVPPMILVFPDGRIDERTSSDSEWANTSSGRFDSYIVDVVHDVDHRFATLPHRQDRIIGGLSAGAYGAINVGLHHLPLFGTIQVWSGYFTETPTGVFAHATPAQLAYNSPIDFVRKLRRALIRYPLRAFLYVGDGDGDRDQLPPMAAALQAEGAHVKWAIYAGGHSWQLWSPRIDQMFIMAAHDIEHPLRPVARRA